ncbi:MAG: hypothetical protein AAFO83_16510, partial [Cyanobacteria bacterium J06607_13]
HALAPASLPQHIRRTATGGLGTGALLRRRSLFHRHAAGVRRMSKRAGLLDLPQALMHTFSTPSSQSSPHQIDTLQSLLFSLLILGDDRTISATYIAGKPAYQKGDPLPTTPISAPTSAPTSTKVLP